MHVNHVLHDKCILSTFSLRHVIGRLELYRNSLVDVELVSVRHAMALRK